MGIQNEKARAIATDKTETADGFGYAFRYRDPRSRMYEVTSDRLEAESAVGEDYDMVLVHFADGLIDRIVGSDPSDGKGFAGTDDGSAVAKPPSDSFDGDVQDGTRHPVGSNHRKRCRRGGRPDHPENGLGLACRYIDPKTGAYGWTPDHKQAVLIAGGDYETFWVCYRHGKIDHAATAEEYQEELEVRVGERISEGLSGVQLNEFDLIDDQAEAARWLERNRPDYREIVEITKREMERGIVLRVEGDEHPAP